MLIDTHAHIFNEYYDDIDQILKDRKGKAVNYIICSGVDDNSNREIIKRCGLYDSLYITLGIHPEYASDYKDSDILFIKNNLNNSKVLAVGEIGLDYHYENYDVDKQIKLFELQLSLAEEYKLPVVIHSRDATLDTIRILKKHNNTGIIHSFSGSYETALEYIKLGYKLGVNGVVTFNNAKIKDVIKKIGIEHIVLETDSPYLTPVPKRGEKNSPDNVEIILDFLSSFLEIDKETISKITTKNAKGVFDKLQI